MEKSGEARAALAIVATVAGTGYASGRELVLFFAQTGGAQWIGISFAAAVFGLLTALLCRWAGRVGADSFAQFCRMLMGRRLSAVAGWLHGLLLAMTAVVMLCGAGEAGALALPLRFGWLWGAGTALLIALIMNLSRLRALPWLGAVVLAAGALFYGALALDARPARIWLDGAVQLALEGSWPAAVLLALAYGAMNAALAANVVLRFGKAGRPWRVGLLCAVALLTLLSAAGAAIARGGRALLGQAMPTVILSARWGLPGFWICMGFGYLCAVTTLAASLGGLIDDLRGGRGGAAAATVLACAALVGLLGLRRTLGAGYPAVGWACAALMLALACRADALLLHGGKRLNFMGQSPDSGV